MLYNIALLLINYAGLGQSLSIWIGMNLNLIYCFGVGDMRNKLFAGVRNLGILLVIGLSLAACGNGSSTGNHLVFNTQPSNTTPMGTTNGIINALQVQIVDSYGHVVKSGNNLVTIAIANQPNTGIYTGILGGTLNVNAQAGSAEFNDLTISQIGESYTLVASAAGITSAISLPFNVVTSTAGYISQSERGVGYEIVNLTNLGSNFQGFLQVYIAQEPNPINADAFATYSASHPGYISNSPRYAIFDYANTLGSPNATPGALTPFTDESGFTWGMIAEVQNYDWPFNPANYPTIVPAPISGWQVGAQAVTVPAGVVKYTSNNKNQLTLFTPTNSSGEPILRFFITDQWGNLYMMKSANYANSTPDKLLAAFESAILPTGWTKSTAYLTQNLYVNPSYGGESNTYASYQEFRDSADNSYCQIGWSSTGNSIAQQILYPMPIWAGASGSLVNGTTGNDIMYGSTGNDQFYPLTGQDNIDGGSGINTVVLTGNSSQYTLTSSGNTTSLVGPDGSKTLTRIQYIQFADKSIALDN